MAMSKSFLLTILAGATVFLATARAEMPTTQQLIDGLSGLGGPRTLMVQPKAESGNGPSSEVQKPRVVLDVTFEFDSDRLTTDAETLLDRLGEAFRSRGLADHRFRLVGHTDGVGDTSYNQRLSERRARAVAAYLQTHHGIAAGRLESLGRGATQLADPAHPESGVNRRVEVINLGR